MHAHYGMDLNFDKLFLPSTLTCRLRICRSSCSISQRWSGGPAHTHTHTQHLL